MHTDSYCASTATALSGAERRVLAAAINMSAKCSQVSDYSRIVHLHPGEFRHSHQSI